MTARHTAMNARLMARYGGAAVLSRVEVPDGIPQNPWEPQPDPVTLTWDVTVIELGVELDHQDGTLIRAGDLVAAMQPHPDVTPSQVDTLTVNGKAFSVMSVQPIRSNPDGPVIHFVLHGRN